MARRKRINRKKRIIIAYSMRILVVLVLAGMIFLMGCGVLYLKEKLSKENDTGENIVNAQESQILPDTIPEPSVDAMAEQEEKGATIVLDAGHGGKDSGTFSGKILEKDIALKVTKEMSRILEEEGYRVVMTREGDDFLKLKERVDIADREDPEVFVSIHCNFYEDSTEVYGMECYFRKEHEESQRFAEAILESVDAAGGTRTRGSREGDYYVLNNNSAPAVLIELGYLSNPTECSNLNNAEHQKDLAQQLADGVMKVLAQEPEQGKELSGTSL